MQLEQQLNEEGIPDPFNDPNMVPKHLPKEPSDQPKTGAGGSYAKAYQAKKLEDIQI